LSTLPAADEVLKSEWQHYRKAEPLPDLFIAALSSSRNSASKATPCAINLSAKLASNSAKQKSQF
jgi:hypothetical protein